MAFVHPHTHSEYSLLECVGDMQVDFELLMDRLSTYRAFEEQANACAEGACKIGLAR